MSLAGEGLVSIWHDIAPEGRDEFYAWHIHEHMPERVGIPGFVRGRRYIAEWGEPEFLTLYEAVSAETLGGTDYLNRLNSPTPWTRSTVVHFRDVSRAIQKVRHSSGPGMGGHVLTLRLEASDPEAFVAAVRQRILAPIEAMHGVCGAHLCQSNAEVSAIETEEKRGRQDGILVPGWSLMVETARPDLADEVHKSYLGAEALVACGAEDGGIAGLYRLEYVRTKNAATA